MAEVSPSIAELNELVALFYPTPQALGILTPVASQQCPAPYRDLLDHDAHMTVTVEKFHRGPVDVQVLECYTSSLDSPSRVPGSPSLDSPNRVPHAGTTASQQTLHTANHTHYMRKIILRRQSDGRVVLYGIVRLALNALQAEVRDQILARQIPLGRVLILHNVLRQVQLNGLWRVECTGELAELFGAQPGHISYGRTALIYCDGEPAVELLEIVAPEESLS